MSAENMKNNTIVGWCGHLLLLAFCGFLVQGSALLCWFFLSMWIHGRQWPREVPLSVASIVASGIVFGVMTLFFFWCGHFLIKKMMNKA